MVIEGTATRAGNEHVAWRKRMKLDHLAKLEFGDESFTYGGRTILYSAIASIEVQPADTGQGSDSPNSAISSLRVHLLHGGILTIGQKRLLWRGARLRLRMEALSQAAEILSEKSFTDRIERLRKSLAGSGCFPFRDYQFYLDGDVRRNGVLLFNLKDKTIAARLGPLELRFVREKPAGDHAAGAALDVDHAIDLSRDRDCLLYMLHHLYQLTWRDEILRTKRLTPRELYLAAIVKLGAQLAKADGTVLPSEISVLKRHFKINRESFPEAKQIFNEALSGNERSESIARQIVDAMPGNPEFHEYVVIGLVMIAASDGAYHPAEHRVIARVAGVLGFSADELDHIIAMCGVRRDEPSDERPAGEAGAGAQAQHLLVLGLPPRATTSQIKTAYHALARKHHPDHLVGRGVPIDRIRAAEDILKTINVSYSWLMTHSEAVASSRH